MSADVCIYCAATGCVSGTAQHGTDCPFMTGLWPITEEDISRETVCAACDEPFAVGDYSAQVTNMAHPAVGHALDLFGDAIEGVSFTVCLPCAALDREVSE